MESLVIIIGICVAVCAVAMLLQIWTWIAFSISAVRILRAFRDRAPHLAAARATLTAAWRENHDEIKRIIEGAKDLAAIARRETQVVHPRPASPGGMSGQRSHFFG